MKPSDSQNKLKENRQAPTIDELYPGLSPEEQEKAKYFLHRYLDLVVRIYERLEREKKLPKILRDKSSEKSAETRPSKSNDTIS